MIDVALRIASQFAPGLVRRLAGERAGEVAEQILSLGRTITGVQSPEDVEAALARDTELSHEFRVQAANLEVELERAYLADRSDARDMRLELARMGKTDWMMYGVGGVVIVGFVVTVLSAFFADLDPEQRYLVFSLAGLLGGMSSQVVSYFFGSSRGSAQKTAMMAASGPQPRSGGNG